MKLKTFLITASLWMGLLGLTACGGADVRTYQYPETALLFDRSCVRPRQYSPTRKQWLRTFQRWCVMVQKCFHGCICDRSLQVSFVSASSSFCRARFSMRLT